MDPVSERDIRSSFINTSQGAAKRLPVPADLAERPWADLDFLGWRDPQSAGRCYVVVPEADRLTGVALTHEKGGFGKAQMCQACLTTHSGGGVSLMAAAKAGESGRRGNTVGMYLCSDLACSLYARRRKVPALGRAHREDFDPDERVARVVERMGAFLDRVRS